VSEFLWRDCLPQSQRLPHIVGAAKGEFDSKALDTGDGFSFTFTKALFLRPASANAGQDHRHALRRGQQRLEKCIWLEKKVVFAALPVRFRTARSTTNL
jgi:hypothetical protein